MQLQFNKEDSPEKLEAIAEKNPKYYFTNAELMQIVNFVNQLSTTLIFKASINSASATPTEPGLYLPTESAIYENLDGIVVDLDAGFTVIAFDGATFEPQIVPIELVDYAKKQSLDLYAKTESLIINESQGNEITNNQLKINPVDGSVFEGSTLESKTSETWYKGTTEKIINTISVPLTRPYYDNKVFTNGVKVRVALNGTFILNRTITLAEIVAGGFNATNGTNFDKLFFELQLPTFKFNLNDVLYVGLECIGVSDKLAFTSTTDSSEEWSERYYLRTSNNITSYESAPEPSGDQGFAFVIRFGFNDYVQEKINASIIDITKQENLNLVERNGFAITNNKIKINPVAASIYGISALESKTEETWYKGVTSKIINTISVPLARPYYDNKVFTDGVKVRVALNGKYILNTTVTLSEINASGLNTVDGSDFSKLFYLLQLPTFEFKANDVLYVGLECIGATDKLAFAYTADTSGEWSDRYYVRTTRNLSADLVAPEPSGDQDFAMVVKFGFNDYIKERIFNEPGLVSISSRNINTYIGGQNWVIDRLLELKPRAKFGFISHHTEDSYSTETKDRYLKNLLDVQQSIADYWGVPICRLDKKLGWIKKNSANTLITNVPDLIHPGTDPTFDSIRQIKIQCVEFLKQFYDDYTGKKIAWYGTSIPYGYPHQNNDTRYPDQVAAELGAIILNNAVSGSVIRRNKFDGTPINLSFLDTTVIRNFQNSMLDLIGTPDEPDVFIFDFGINDFVLDKTDFDFDLKLN